MSFYLVDGTGYIYRAYYAIRELRNSKGFPTNAIFGFTSMMLKLVRERKPDGLIVVFDSPEPTEKHRLFPQYKAHRTKPPDDMIAQIRPIRDVIEAMSIGVISLAGYEADDILATLAKRLAPVAGHVYVVTSDKDMLQVVQPRVTIYDPVKNAEYDEEFIFTRFGLPPARIRELMALTGDSTDNIPGVKGVGEKTAIGLLKDFSSLDDLMNNYSKIPKERLRNLIAENLDTIDLTLKLVSLDVNVPIDVEAEALSMTTPDWKRLRTYFAEFGFSSLMKMIPADAGTSPLPVVAAARQPGAINQPESAGAPEVANPPQAVKPQIANEYEVCGNVGALAATLPREISLAISVPSRGTLIESATAIALYTGDDKACCANPGALTGKNEADTEDRAANDMASLTLILADDSVAKTGHDLKAAMHRLAPYSLTLAGTFYDTMVASYLLNPDRANHTLENVLLDHLSYTLQPGKDDETDLTQRAAKVMEARLLLFNRLRETGLMRLYEKVEMPLIYVLYDMERHGIKLDEGRLRDLSKELDVQIRIIEKRIFALAGEEFNVNSSKQLADILFNKLKLPSRKKTKSGYSTDVVVLEALAQIHELPSEILNYRTLTKLKNTYLDTLPAYVNARTGRLHTIFNQTAAATGRLSSSDPNLQNIPIKGEWGTRIREAFVAEAGNVLISADYSQIELRVLAHLSGDAALAEAFTHDRDIHMETAKTIFSAEQQDVTADMRRIAKSINFGIVYGMSPYGMSEQLKISTVDAKRYIDAFFGRHGGLRDYIDRTIEETRLRGYSLTLLGRTRPIAGLTSSNKNIVQQAERMAINTPIQGSAADIIKVAMINVHRRIKAEGLQTRMILQVHDELVLEAPIAEVEAATRLVKEEMEHAFELRVPVRVDVGAGKNWAEAH
ncbi:MAG: DNA polymerase I [Nitrospirae bacterium]|nr:DNA polymerase I [Nitrospirota bacterium]